MPLDVDAFSNWASLPFQPEKTDPNGTAIDVQTRVVTALEYIAAQLGEISRKMDHIETGKSATREDFDKMNELLKKL